GGRPGAEAEPQGGAQGPGPPYAPAGGHAAARAAAATGFADGSGGDHVPEAAVEMAALLAACGTGARGLGEGFTEHVGAGGDVGGRRGQGGVGIELGVAGGGAAGRGGAGGGQLGRTSGVGAPYFVPIVFVPNINIKEKETDKKGSR
ncbi:unnamed protein product, partial [Urochloa humidicola]